MSKEKRGEDVEFVREDLEYIVKYLDEALGILGKKKLGEKDRRRLRKLISRVLRRAHASLIGLVKNMEGKTMLVDHLVVNGKGSIKHYGIHGVRGHRLDNPGEVQFKDKHGRPVEYEEMGTITKHTRKGRRTYRKKTRRVKKAG